MAEKGISPLPRDARPYQGRRAGLVTRFVAAMIDSVVVTAAMLVSYAGLAGLRFLVDPRNFSMPDGAFLQSVALWMGLLVVYLTVAWWVSGRTYGNLVMGLRVVGYRGEKLGFVGALLRALAYAVFPIGLVWCAISSENRSLQDAVLRTSVIYDWQPRTPPQPR